MLAIHPVAARSARVRHQNKPSYQAQTLWDLLFCGTGVSTGKLFTTTPSPIPAKDSCPTKSAHTIVHDAHRAVCDSQFEI